MSSITRVLFSNIILPFLEHPQDDTSLRQTRREWRFVFPNRVNLCIKNAINVYRLYFLIDTYHQRKSTLYSIDVNVDDHSPHQCPPLPHVEKLSMRGSFQPHFLLAALSPERLKVVSFDNKAHYFWKPFVELKNFKELHTLTVIYRGLSCYLITDAEDLNILKTFPLQKLRIGDFYLDQLSFESLLKLPHLKELRLNRVNYRLFTSQAFRTSAQNSLQLTQINDYPDTVWRPILQSASDEELIDLLYEPILTPSSQQMTPALPVIIPLEILAPPANPPPTPRRTCHCLFRLCEILYAALLRFIHYFSRRSRNR